MNLEEARNNIGAEVELDESTKPYTYTIKKTPVGHTHEYIENNLKGNLMILRIDQDGDALIETENGARENIHPRHLKLKPQNYKISLVSSGDAIEAQRLFFSIGYKFGGIGTSSSSRMKNIFAEGKSKLLSNEEFKFNELDAKQITLQELRDMVAKKKGEDKKVQATGAFRNLYKEMTWEDALDAFKEGKEVELINACGEWHDISHVILGDLPNGGFKFRIAPQRITLNGEYTKEELLQKIGEMK